jgi:putative transposase
MAAERSPLSEVPPETDCQPVTPTSWPAGYTGASHVEYATAGWVDWYNHRRLHGSLGMLTPTEYEQHHYAAHSREPQPHMRAAQSP